MANNTSQYIKGGSPVADFSKVGQIGLSFYAARAARDEARHKELLEAVAVSDAALANSKKYIMSLPPDVASIYSEKVDVELQKRAEAIMKGGSSTSMGASTQAFQDLSIGAAKMSTISNDLVTKFEKMRQSDDYLSNKEVYDEWFDKSKQVITETAKGDIDAIAQLDFFQPPVAEQDMDIIKYGANEFQNAFNPNQYVKTKKDGSVVFQESEALINAGEYIEKQYDVSTQWQTDIDALAVSFLNPELDPSEANDAIVNYKNIEDRLSVAGITTVEQVDAVEGITATDKRELKSGLMFIDARDGVKADIQKGLVNSIRIADRPATSSSSEGGLDLSDYPGSAGVLSIESLNIAPEAAKKLGLDASGIYGASGTKGRSHRLGQGTTTIYIDGILYDGTNYYGNAQVLSPTFMEEYLSGQRSTEELNDALMSGGEFVPEIVNMSRIAGDIPTKDLRAMKAVAKIQYLSAVANQPE